MILGQPIFHLGRSKLLLCALHPMYYNTFQTDQGFQCERTKRETQQKEIRAQIFVSEFSSEQLHSKITKIWGTEGKADNLDSMTLFKLFMERSMIKNRKSGGRSLYSTQMPSLQHERNLVKCRLALQGPPRILDMVQNQCSRAPEGPQAGHAGVPVATGLCMPSFWTSVSRL